MFVTLCLPAVYSFEGAMSYTFNITGSSARRLLRFQELIVCVYLMNVAYASV